MLRKIPQVRRNKLINPLNPPPFIFEPIGFIYTTYETGVGTPIQPTAANELGKIILNKELETGLQDLDGFSHIILLYVFDRIKQSKLLVSPFLDETKRGIFSTRAPTRPVPIGLSIVRLIKIEGNHVTFSGADMLNNTPLLDIKPYVPSFDQHDVDRIGWLEDRINRLPETRDDGRFLDT